MKKNRITQMMWTALGLFLLPFAYAGQPLWTFTPSTNTVISISPGGTATVTYTVTNQSRRTHTLAMRAIPGITQVASSGNCSAPFTLAYHQSCSLQLHVDGSALAGNVVGGPDVCQANSDGSPNPNQCYRPSQGPGGGALQITKIPVATAFSVGGTVSGLTTTGLVLRQDTSGDVLPIDASGFFAFPSSVAAGAPYNVIIQAQPTGQICTVTNGSGTMDNTNVTNILVTCASGVQTVGGTVNGLTGNLVLLLNGGNALTMNADGSFTFATPLPAGSSYAVTIQSQPSGQLCAVNNGTGTITDMNVTNVAVHCAPIANARTIGGTITGLTGTGTVVLQNNGGDNYTTSANGGFTFATPLPQGSTYNVTVAGQPVGQICTVSGNTGTGTVGSSNVTSVVIICSASAFTVGGNVLGLIGTEPVQVQLNGGALLSVNPSAVSYVFPEPIAQGASYIVTVVQQPTGQTCTVQNSTGIMGGANVTNVDISCTVNQATLSANVHTLLLSVAGLIEYGVPQAYNNTYPSGRPRMIIIKNTGIGVATNLAVTLPTFPTGTTVMQNTCSGGISLTPGGSCIITIKPGLTATSNDAGNSCATSHTGPTPATVTVTANNASMASIDVVVLDYACVYQDGYVYAFNDLEGCSSTDPEAPCPISVYAKAATLEDQVAPPPSPGAVGIIWSSDGTPTGVADDVIYGVSDTSTSAVPYPSEITTPSANRLPGQENCNGNTDGACATKNIVIYYSPPNTSPAVNYSLYAVGICKETIDGHSDWYLPAPYELGLAGGVNANQNMMTNISFAFPTIDAYWTSNQNTLNPQFYAWNRVHTGAPSGYQDLKSAKEGVHCSRIITSD